ncbi:hypothetical protein Tco_0821769 [Tanacetum coccineum]|uniref:Uncharacterized protein n=1 Tax=Tanacetum coccineum TaxID=301880 RepID=A0ABQ5AD89_9ASTR
MGVPVNHLWNESKPYREGFGAFVWQITILVTISKTVLRHSKLFEGFKVQLGEDPIRARRGGLRPREEDHIEGPSRRAACIELYVGLYTHSFSLANLRLPLTEFSVKFSNISRFIYLGLTLLVVSSSPLLLSCARLMVVSPLSTSSEGSSICVELDPSPGFGIGSPSVSVNTEPMKADEELVIQPVEVTTDFRESPKPKVFVVYPRSVAARVKDRKCKTRGGSSRPPVKRKLAPGSSTSRATHAKTSSSKDDVPFLTVSDDDEGLPDVLELKDATACHLKISAITPPA